MQAKKFLNDFFFSGNICRLWLAVLALMYAFRRHWPALNWLLLLLAAAVTILYAQKHRHVSRQDDRTLTVDLVVCGLAFLWGLSVCLSG